MARSHRQDLVADLLKAAHILGGLNCLPATDGNLSARLTNDTVLLTARGTEKRALQATDLLDVSLRDERSEMGSTEWAMHRTLYLKRTDVNCVLHVHSPGLTAFAAAHRVPNINLLSEAYLTVGAIALVPFVSPGTPLVGQAMIETDVSASIYLLSNHGAVAVGRSVRESLHRLERAEFLARVELAAESIGGAKSMLPTQLAQLR